MYSQCVFRIHIQQNITYQRTIGNFILLCVWNFLHETIFRIIFQKPITLWSMVWSIKINPV